MPEETFLHVGETTYSLNDLYHYALYDMGADSPGFFPFLVAVETLKELKALSTNVKDINLGGLL